MVSGYSEGELIKKFGNCFLSLPVSHTLGVIQRLFCAFMSRFGWWNLIHPLIFLIKVARQFLCASSSYIYMLYTRWGMSYNITGFPFVFSTGN